MNVEKVFDAYWTGWLRENIAHGTDFQETFGTLRKAGFSDQAIAERIDAIRPVDSALASGKLHPPPLLRRNPAKLRKIDTPKIDLYTYEDFLSKKECERLIALINHHLRPSPLSYDPGDSYFRTSQTCYLSHLRSPHALALTAKICKTLGIRPEYGEGAQAQRYDVGQQFKPHWDFFKPDTREYLRFAGIRGNRTWTFMVYLNEGMEGGGTRFTEIDYTVQPKTGMALLWNNLREDGSPNTDTMHSGEPVIKGHKVIITTWFRVLGYGQQFFE
jgi:prolyl 4-hydroxylase